MTTGFPSLIFPRNLGKVGNRFVAPFRVKNWKSEPIIVSSPASKATGRSCWTARSPSPLPRTRKPPLDVPIRLPLSYPAGDHAANVQLLFQNDLRISPTSGTLSFTYTGKGVGGLPLPRLTYLYIVYIILALALLYALIRLFLFLRKKMQEMPAPGLRKAPRPAGGARRESRRAAAERAQAAGGAGAARPAGPGKRVPLLSTGIRAGRCGTDHARPGS